MIGIKILPYCSPIFKGKQVDILQTGVDVNLGIVDPHIMHKENDCNICSLHWSSYRTMMVFDSEFIHTFSYILQNYFLKHIIYNST